MTDWKVGKDEQGYFLADGAKPLFSLSEKNAKEMQGLFACRDFVQRIAAGRGNASSPAQELLSRFQISWTAMDPYTLPDSGKNSASRGDATRVGMAAFDPSEHAKGEA